jgi:DNA invertase Pin-like site-specific DNA recombinase
MRQDEQIHAVPEAAASYARKSDANDEGVLDQHLLNEQRARRDGFVVPKTSAFRFSDDKTSGVTKRRNGLDALISLVKTGDAPFKRVYVKDKTRLGRWNDPRYQFYLAVLFEEHGVRIMFSENERDIDYASAGENPEMVGFFMKEAVDGVVSSEERKRLMRRVRGALRTNVLKGFYPGALAPYGMERWLADEKTGDLLEFIPEGETVRRKGCRYKLIVSDGPECSVVRRVFTMIEAGHSLASVARALNADGIPTPSDRGIWRPEAVRRIARNSIYCGDLKWGRTRPGEAVAAECAEVDGREPIMFRDFVANPPVSRELWTDVQAILDGNRDNQSRRRAASPDYLLSGLVHCSGCGAGWYGHTSTVRGRTRRRYYRHAEVEPGSERCPGENRYVRADALEAQVLGQVTRLLSCDSLRDLTREAIADRIAAAESLDHAREEASIVKRLEKYNRALALAIDHQVLAESEAAAKAFAAKVQQYGRHVDQLRSQLGDLQAERMRLEKLANQTSSLVKSADDLLALLQSGTDLDRKEVVAAVIHGIRVSPDVSEAELAVRAF